MMKICFNPFQLNENKYVDIIVNAMNKNGIEVYSLKEVAKSLKLLNEIKIFHFNWYENLNEKTVLATIFKYVEKIIFIKVLKLLNKKIVWTMHNKVQHNAKVSFLSRSLLKFIAKNSDKIFIHSNESRDVLYNYTKSDDIMKKLVYMEHPNYIDVYPGTTQDMRKQLDIKKEDLVLLFVGQVRPYKNIEVLIKAFEDLNYYNVKLIIAGKPINEDYKLELHERLKDNKNIIPIFQFVDDDQLIELLNTSNIVVLPYDIESSLNSGTIFLSFSNNKTVISSCIGTIKDLEDEDFYFTYEYDTDLNHISNLKNVIKKVYKVFSNDETVLHKMGQQAFKYVENNNNAVIIAQKLSNIYSSLLNKN